jgi:hypothetical protein
VAHETVFASWSAGESYVRKLAQFFPDATPVRLPVQIVGIDSHGTGVQEHTVVEFGTPCEVMFASTLPLEFGDRVRVETPDGSLIAESTVVAVQYHEGKMAVAVRFCGEVANWIIKR